MPSAPEFLRNEIEILFGSIDAYHPLKYLIDNGYKDVRGIIVLPTPEHKETEKETICINFLCSEWDFGFSETNP